MTRFLGIKISNRLVTRFLGIKISNRPVTDMLQQHSISTPETILANLLALRIAQFPADSSAPYKGQGCQEIELRDGRKLDVQVDSRVGWESVPYNVRYWKIHGEVRVIMPGRPRHITTTLRGEDAWLVIHQFYLWRQRSIALAKLEADAENQQNALSIVEGLI